ncbi:MAG: hypothetical protein WA160_03595 [Pseudobdellovibrio sp.]
MKKNKLLSWSMTHLAWLTMTFSPMAMGAEAEKISKQKMQQYLQEAGLTKATTVGEFWHKTQAYYPGYLYKEIESFALQNKNVQMPEVTLSSAKATDGSEIPILSYSMGGKSFTLQFFGEKNKWVKFNNVNLSVTDLANPEDIVKRLKANDIHLKNEYHQLSKKSDQASLVDIKKIAEYKKDFSRFQGFPRITPVLWKSLSAEKRANYIVKMRLMWLSAQRVLELKNGNATAFQQTPIEQFYKAIFGNNAQAEEAFEDELAPPTSLPSNGTNSVRSEMVHSSPTAIPSAVVKLKDRTVTLKNGKKVIIPFDAKTCIVAGYVGAYGIVTNSSGKDRPGCSVDVALAAYDTKETDGKTVKNETLKYVTEANDDCKKDKGQGFRACNPILYSYSSVGKPFCIDTLSKSFQDATTSIGPCESASPLSTTNLDKTMTFDKDYSNIMPEQKRLALIEADQKNQDFKLTKEFINGVLQKKDPLLIAMLKNGDWNQALDDELVRIQNHFETGINAAIMSCEATVKAGNNQEKKQKDACDQLHRRWLFTERIIADYRSKACLDGSKYIGAYEANESSVSSTDSAKEKTKLNKSTISGDGKDLCMCPMNNLKVSFGKTCTQQVVIAECRNGKKDKTGNCVEKCPVGASALDVRTKQHRCTCDKFPDKSVEEGATDEEAKDICKAESNTWKWVLGIGIGIGIVAWLMNRHKSKPVTLPVPPVCNDNQKIGALGCMCKGSCAEGTMLNPISCQCAELPTRPSCAPKVGTYPACACPPSSSCTPPQGIYNQLTCQCDTIKTPVICADGSAAQNNKCNCPDGSTIPTGGCSAGPVNENTGNKGDNCPQGNCNGGIPTTK